ncbi:hypothetical protein [uncultured Desulfosarcina sp.]|uniref:hypothetical protein n=1 Tax=uncultured Desulfosarcina sp. TaxID=218289 RepID=UPI0029C78B48|nr:hypothetical protein [uncultured Desulfosarcina sp.]
MNADVTHPCGKYGLCLASCPVYRVMREETTVPRTKVHLIQSCAEGRLPVRAAAACLFSSTAMLRGREKISAAISMR